MLMGLLTLFLTLLAAMFAKTLILTVWLRVRWRLLGRKPKLILDSALDDTVAKCSPRLVGMLTNCADEDEALRMIEEYTRWAVETYIDMYLTIGTIVIGDRRLPNPRRAEPASE